MLAPLAILAMLAPAQTPSASPKPPDPRGRPELVTSARELLGVPFDLGGRLQAGRGIDCQGVVFYAAERSGRCGWRSFSVMPTRTVERGELGRPVPGVSPAARDDVDPSRLVAGDVLFLLSPVENPAEPALVHLGDGERRTPLWVWHMGLYAGDGKVLHADPFRAGQVVEEDLREMLAADGFTALYATRLAPGEAPAPARCRRHAPMKRTTAGPEAPR